jgi:hypothetical protein
MQNPETGKTADVHPNEVDNWKAHGWREAAPTIAPLPPPPALPAEKAKLSLPNKKD